MQAPYASESVTITSGTPPGVGTEFVMKGRLRSRLFARVIEWEEEKQLAFEIYRSEYPSDRLTFERSVISIQLEPLDGGRTRVRCSHLLAGKGALGRLYAATVMRPLIATNVRRILDSLAASGVA